MTIIKQKNIKEKKEKKINKVKKIVPGMHKIPTKLFTKLCMGLLIGLFTSLFSMQADGATEAIRLQKTIDEMSAPMQNAPSIFDPKSTNQNPTDQNPTEWSDLMLNRVFPFIASMYYDGIMFAQDLTTTNEHAENVQLLQTIINEYKKMVMLITDSLLLTKKTDADNREGLYATVYAVKHIVDRLEQILSEQTSNMPRSGNAWAQELLAHSKATIDSIAQKIIDEYKKTKTTH